MAKTSCKLSLIDLIAPIDGLDDFHDMHRVDTASLRRRLMENFHPASHYASCISSGMMSGTVCDGDADCGDATGADSAPAAAADDDDGGDPDPEPERRRVRKANSDRVTKAGRASTRAAQATQTSDDAGPPTAKTSSIGAKPHYAAATAGNPYPAQAPLTHASTTVRRDAATTTTAGDQTSLPQNLEIALWRLPTVLRHVPVSRSGWWAGVRDGRYPQPVRLSARCVAWRASDIRDLIESL